MYEDDRPFIVRILFSWRVIPLIILLLVLVPIIGFLAFQKVTDSAWRTAYDAIEVPDGVTFHTDLVAWRAGEPLDANARRAPYGIGLAEADERIGRWTSLRDRVQTQVMTDIRWDSAIDSLDVRFADLSRYERNQIEGLVVDHQGILNEVRELARLGGPVILLDNRQGLALELPHLAWMRAMARILSVSARARFYRGDTAAGLEDITRIFELADAIAPEYLLINQLVRIAVTGIAWHPVQFELNPVSLSQAQLDNLFARLRASSHRARFAECYVGEVLTVYNTPGNFWEWDFGGNTDDLVAEESRKWLPLYKRFLGGPWRNMDKQLHCSLLVRTAEASQAVYYQAHPLLEEIIQDFGHAPALRVMTRSIGEDLVRATKAQARLDAQIGLTQLGILVERYKSKHKSYPDSLDAIAGELGGELPLDPYSGEPYRYLLESGFLYLYSVGDNLEDDGGWHDYKQGDILWRGES